MTQLLNTIKRHPLKYLLSLAIATLIALLLGWVGIPALSQANNPQLALFDEVWETVGDRFFDPQLNGVDWNAMKQRYRPQVAQTRSREAAAVVINQMIGELKTSHTRLFIPEEPNYYQVLGIFAPRDSRLQEQVKKVLPQGKIEYTGIGAVTTDIDGKTFVRAVLNDSPAASAGIKTGDQILSVDRQPFHAIKSFAGKAGQEVNVQVVRSPSSPPQEITVKPKVFDGVRMFMDAQRESVEVINQSGRKIGYIHVWSYANDEAQEILESELIYGRLRNADALVLDLREGWGGAPLTVLNIYSDRGPTITSIDRDGDRYTSDSSWKKPVVMLVNDGSRSAKEILAYAFKKDKFGPVVGSRTAGAVVAGRAFLMRDGSLLYVAVADVFVDGNQRLEGVGVVPDVVVDAPIPYANGADPQKQRAIAVAIEQVR